MVHSSQHAKAVLTLVVLISLAAGGVLMVVEPNVDTDLQAGYFGTSDDQANAFRQLREEVAGVNSEIIYFELIKGARDREGNAVNAVNELPALQAQEELFNFIKTEFKARTGQDKILSHTSLAYFTKLIYMQFPQSGGEFTLPGSPEETQLAFDILKAADSGGATGLYHSEDMRAAVMFLIYDPDTTHLSKKETGGIINELIGEYREMSVDAEGPKTFDLWKPAYFDSWGVQSWIYVIDEQVAEESKIFVGAVFAFLAVTLMVLFRNVKRVLIGVSTVFIILLWTLAGMTVGGVAVGFVSMAMFPLLLGVGVDYVIHIINEFGTERATVANSQEAFEHIGQRGAMALFISTLTTITGFVVMITSTSPMIVEICVATILGILSVFLLSITFVPAMLQLSARHETKEVLRPGHMVSKFMTAAGKYKAVTIPVLLLGTLFFASFIDDTEYVVGTVEVNLPQKELWTHEEDRAHMLDMYERFQTQINAVGQETVIQIAPDEGGLATRPALDDMIAVHKEMAANEFVQSAGKGVNSVPSILVLYETLKDGLQSAGPAILEPALLGGSGLPCEPPLCFPGLEGDSYDDQFGILADYDDAKILAAYDDMLGRPEWAPLLLTFMDETYSIGWALTFVNIQPVDQASTEKANEAFSQIVEDADPEYTDTYYFGTLTGIKKYNDYTNKWLTISSIASLVVVGALVGAFTRSIRAVLAVLIPMSLTFVWWLGSLPTKWVDIDLAFIFMIPIAFITSLGSDYAVHLAYNLQEREDPRFVYKTVGKAVVFSAFTTIVSFFIFTRGAIRGSYEMFQAAVIAIAMMTFLTLVTIPLLYNGKVERFLAARKAERDQ